jgi:hypothetical protein
LWWDVVQRFSLQSGAKCRKPKSDHYQNSRVHPTPRPGLMTRLPAEAAKNARIDDTSGLEWPRDLTQRRQWARSGPLHRASKTSAIPPTATLRGGGTNWRYRPEAVLPSFPEVYSSYKIEHYHSRRFSAVVLRKDERVRSRSLRPCRLGRGRLPESSTKLRHKRMWSVQGHGNCNASRCHCR